MMTKRILLIAPFIILTAFLSAGATPISYTLLMASWMVSWWIFEIMPLGITALIPSVLLPLLQIMPLKKVLSFYSHPIIYLFLGGFIIAQALEKTKLSERFAIFILRMTGKSAQGVVLGFIIATAFLSMWISNTATTVMMIPIADSILKFIEKHTDNDKRELRAFSICTMLSIAYAANIGGTMTPIGTPPNVVLMGYLEELFQVRVDFFKWMMIVSPVAITLLICVFYINSYFLYPFKIKLDDKFQLFLSNHWRSLGKPNKQQKITMVIFIFICSLWIFKRPLNSAIGTPVIQDTIVALFGGILFFLVPANKDKSAILKVEDINKLPWNIVLLFGGGMALANSLSHVGVLEQVATAFQGENQFTLYWFVFISSTLVLFLTEVMSNVALCTVALPVFLTLAITQGYSPLTVGIPITLCASYAFGMPISTPPNAIVFSTGKISMRHMLKAGILTNVISILITMSIGWGMIMLIVE